MSNIKTVKTFFALDEKGNCPEGSHKENLYGKVACAVYCDPSKISGGNIPCTVKNMSFNVENKNLRYNGSAMQNSNGFFSTGEPDGKITCSSAMNQTQSWRFDPKDPSAPYRSCCVDTTDSDSNCAPKDPYWPSKKGLDPYIYGCDSGNCFTDYGGEYLGEDNCETSCHSPPQDNSTTKTFFLPDSTGKCPKNRPAEMFRGAPACSIYCDKNPGGDILSCDAPGITYSKKNGNFRYNGSAIDGPNYFRFDGVDSCRSRDSGDDLFRVPGNKNDSCCLPTPSVKEDYDGPDCAPDPDRFWRKPTTANNPYLFSCDDKDDCVSSYNDGKYTEGTCNNECGAPLNWKCSDPTTSTCVQASDGAFSTEDACKKSSACQPSFNWKCSDRTTGTCVQASDGTFSTEDACKKSPTCRPVVPPAQLYKCVGGNCVIGSGGTMTYDECEKGCGGKTKSNLPMILGVGGGVIFLFIAAALVYFFMAKKKYKL